MEPTIQQFSDSLVETGLMSHADIRDVVNGLPAERRPQDAQGLIRELVRLHKLTTYQAQQIYQGNGKGLHLGNYAILDKIGQGGMGTVLKAEHKRMRRVVALKVIGPKSSSSQSAARRFHREVEAAAKLIHPNIVTAFDADEADGTNFLVMEFVDGADLSTLVKLDGPLPVETAVNCVLQAARGLEYAHSKGVVHRDIKPRNLLLDRDGTVKILDMGLARVETSSGADQTDLTGSGQIMGTIDYMAPEQAVNPKDADERADVYSLGITLWYLLTGRIVYRGQTILEKLVAHREQPVPSLAEACPSVSAELDAVFRKMLAKKPQQRYQNMTALIADLERCRIDPCASPTITLDPDDGRHLQAFLQGMESASNVRRSLAAARPASSSTIVAPPIQLPVVAAGDTVISGDSATDNDPETVEPPLPPLDFSAKPAKSSSLSAARPKASPAARATKPARRPQHSAAVVVGALLIVLALAAGALLFAFREHLRYQPGQPGDVPRSSTA
jgi:serine/threonine protein kinase